MGRFKVVVTDQVFPDVDVERELLASVDADLVVADGTAEGVVAQARDADALLNTYLPVDADLIAQLERCRIIARYGIGVDNIDIEAAEKSGIVVTNVPDYCVEEVALHTAALLLALLRKVVEGDRLVRQGKWGIDELRPMRRVGELTVGLVGYGRIARRVGDIVRVLGADLLVYDPYVTAGPDGPRLVELDELLAGSDAISVHAPLTPQTRGLIGERELALMPDSAVLVNTSRGPLIAFDALEAALRRGDIAAAALDVFEAEPPDAQRVREVPNLVATPHSAFYSEEALRESQRKAATQIVKVLSGQDPDYRVQPS